MIKLDLSELAYDIGKYAYAEHQTAERQRQIEEEKRRLEEEERRRKEDEMLNAPPEYIKRLTKDKTIIESQVVYLGTCGNCGNAMTNTNKILICNGCGNKFCQTCDTFYEKKLHYRKERLNLNFPLCRNCYQKVYVNAVQIIDKKKEQEAQQEFIKKERVAIKLLEDTSTSNKGAGWIALMFGFGISIYFPVEMMLNDDSTGRTVTLMFVMLWIGSVIIILGIYLIVDARRDRKKLESKKSSIAAINMTPKNSQQDFENTENFPNPIEYCQQPQPQCQKQPLQQRPPPIQQHTCPSCGETLVFLAGYNSYYCYTCQIFV